MAKRQMYLVGVFMKDGSIKYVTSLADRNWAKWDDGETAMEFSKEFAIDMCRGFAWNGIIATPILKLDWLDYKNEVKEDAQDK